MLSEDELRCVIEQQRGFLECMVDPVERKVMVAFIDGLECALNE